MKVLFVTGDDFLDDDDGDFLVEARAKLFIDGNYTHVSLEDCIFTAHRLSDDGEIPLVVIGERIA